MTVSPRGKIVNHCGCPQSLIAIPSLLDGICDPAAIIDSDFCILAANQVYRDKFNRGQKVCGQSCHEVSHQLTVPCSQAGESCPIERAQQNRTRAQALHIHHTCEGEEHEMVTIHPLVDDSGQVTAYLELLSPARVATARPRRGDGLVGHSPAFNHMLALLARAAPAPTTVLLLGESGTGKELAARALHDMSPRARSPFVPVDCSGLTETLFESELFGHEKGSFTGATSRKKGLVESAHEGTLFVDEVGDIPLSLQVKLLRLLETGVFRRVGSVEQIHSDFRLVCATHRDLQKMVEQGTFRADLYYRISAFPVELPPLRARREDIPLLIDALIDRMGCSRIGDIHPETSTTSLNAPACWSMVTPYCPSTCPAPAAKTRAPQYPIRPLAPSSFPSKR